LNRVGRVLRDASAVGRGRRPVSNSYPAGGPTVGVLIQIKAVARLPPSGVIASQSAAHLAPKTKLLARNNKTRCRCSGNPSATAGTASRLIQHPRAAPTMNRDDGLFWISLIWFVVLCGAELWAIVSF